MRGAWTVAVCMLLAACADDAPQPDQESDDFVAVGGVFGRKIRLEFTPPDFVLTLDGDRESTGPSGRFVFFARNSVDTGGNEFVGYRYRGPTDKLIIWTRIKAVAQSNLDHMKIDRAPFCIVQMTNPAGVFAFPLDREGAPEDEKFRASGPILFEEDGKWGYRDPSNTRVAIEPRFDSAGRFASERAWVNAGGLTGCIDPTGKYVLEPVARLLCSVRGPGSAGAEFVVDPTFDDARWFSEGLAAVARNKKWGYIDREGRIVIDLEYDTAFAFREGYAVVERGTVSGIVDKKGRFEEGR